ncbi:MAG: hypothetical protein PHH01_03905 [Patescibacteria group bacterium]|nr:hypothetical protein [Patescibacteria group bacterium]
MKNNPSGKIEFEQLQFKEPLSEIGSFLDFAEKEVSSEVIELSKFKNENNRKHLQKLVYVNLVNRFDYLIDKLLLWFCTNNKELRDEVLSSVANEYISKKDVFEYFLLKDQSAEIITENIKDLARLRQLKERHSAKIHKIEKLIKVSNIDIPRVNYSNGKIYQKCKTNKTIPNTIHGYSDYLYSRRNSIVHGDGTNYTNNDYDKIKDLYKVRLPKSFKLQLSSIRTAANFYKDLIEIFKKHFVKLG